MQPNQQVVDETGVIHRLARRLGKGGQGEVWLTEAGRRIIKIRAGSGRSAEELRRRITAVRRLNLSRDVHIAKPLAVLRPPLVGYVAEFLGDMVPIHTLLKPPPERSLADWHIETGGLRRRLRLLAHAGEALVALHAHGVIYADVSPLNVFVSEPVTATEAWLIDPDNLTHDADPKQAIHTPGFGAPEVVARSAGCTSLSDAWSFAVLAWQTLTLTHPFVGDAVNDGDPDLEEQAFAGRLPWVGHSTDRCNACSSGLPPDLVMGNRLIDLARRTFEHGLRDRLRRPGVAEWVERLHSAADQTIRCSTCSGTYLCTTSSCPWCDAARPDPLRVRLVRWQPGPGLVRGMAVAQLPLVADPLVLTRRITLNLSGPTGRESHLILRLIQRGIHVQVSPGHQAWVGQVDSKVRAPIPVNATGHTVDPKGWMIFFEPPDTAQRVALLGGEA